MFEVRTVHSRHHHFGWDNRLAPALEVAPGDTVSFELVDASGGQLEPTSTVDDLTRLDFARVNPVTGPVSVLGAKPGDALEVHILEFAPSGWGWTANIPGFGLLADQFLQPHLKLWTLGRGPAEFGSGIRIPQRPFPGTIGLAPEEPGTHSVVPPSACGGNLDIRDLTEGSTLYLPVQVPGALFSVGDSHAAQGDGEVCGTALESPMTVTLRFGLHKGANLPSPQFETAGPVTQHLDEGGYFVTTGVGPDLFVGARDAVMAMIDHLGRRYGLPPEDAYLLRSVACDLRVSEIVDVPNWVVSFYLPKSIFS